MTEDAKKEKTETPLKTYMSELYDMEIDKCRWRKQGKTCDCLECVKYHRENKKGKT